MPNTDELPKFEIGLVMAGAISAGAYSAGVLDFLIEAIDAWEADKASAPADTPQHCAAIKVLSGASAGSITGAILAACVKYDFPHIRPANMDRDGDENPLYCSWVKQIDISCLLGTRDLQGGQKAISLLDSSRLLDIARNAMDYGAGKAVKSRPYLCDPLRFMFTLTNLRGIPYSYSLRANAAYGQDMTRHGDCMRFALKGLGKVASRPIQGNEYALEYPGSGTQKWDAWGNPFAMSALASGAFPIGLAPRVLVRRTADYDFDQAVIPGGAGMPACTQAIKPNWTSENPNPGASYQFVNVDGGTIDNEPMDLARIELAGGDPLARNERSGERANRALLLIDPFTGPDKPGPSKLEEISFLGSVLSLFGSLKDQARFKPEDIALADDDTVYSRFMVAPSRGAKTEDTSDFDIACGCLGGFGGFLSQKFREHDYFLGRRNCQQFLAQYFSLPETNPLFANWTQDQKNRYRIPRTRRDGTTVVELPIIPLAGRLSPATAPEPLLDWPANAVDPDSLREPIENRLDGLYSSLVTEWKGLLLKIGWVFFLKPRIIDRAVSMMTADLKRHRLLRD